MVRTLPENFRLKPFSLRLLAITFLLAGQVSSAAEPSVADSGLTFEALIERHYPGATLETRVLTLTEEDLDQMVPRLGFSVLEKRYRYFLARLGSKELGKAFVLTRRVRNQDQTAIYFVSSKGQVDGIEVIKFNEGAEYAASEQWLKKFDGMKAKDHAKVGTDVPAITGSTFTAQSYLQGAQLALALAARLNPKPAASKSKSKLTNHKKAAAKKVK